MVFSLRNLCVLGGSAIKEFAKPDNSSQKPSNLFVDSLLTTPLTAAENAEVAQRIETAPLLIPSVGLTEISALRYSSTPH